MSDQIRVNGNLYSYGSIKIKIDGTPFYGFNSISYGDSRTRSKSYGTGKSQSPRGKTRGKYETDPVTLSGDKDTVREFRKALADAGDGRSAADTLFQIVVTYSEDGLGQIVDEIEDCHLSKNTSSSEEGGDPLKEDVEIDCMRIRWDGITMFDESDGT